MWTMNLFVFVQTFFQAVDRCGGKLVNLFTLTVSYHQKDRVQPVPVGEVAEEVSLWRQPTLLDMAKSTSMGETHKVMEEEELAEELEFMLISRITLAVSKCTLIYKHLAAEFVILRF